MNPTEIWPFAISGVVIGSMYGLVASGLVLTYRVSKIFNFAHGALAMLSAYVYVTLSDTVGLPVPLAFVLTVFGFAPILGAVLERILFRRLIGATTVNKVIATVGLFVLVTGFTVTVFGPAGRRVEGVFPSSNIGLGGNFFVGVDQIGIIAVGLVTALMLLLFLSRTTIGTAIVAVVDRRDVAALAGVDVDRMSRVSWMLGTVMAAIAGVLLAPLVILDSVFFSLIVIQALAGAMFGYMRSVPWAFTGGVTVGLAEALFGQFAPSTGFFIGLRSSLSFVILFGVLAYYSVRGLGKEEAADESLLAQVGERAGVGSGPAVKRLVGARRRGAASWRNLWGGGLVAAMIVVAPLVMSPSWRFTMLIAVPVVILFLSLTLLTGVAGQVSLCQAAFMGVGAFFAARVVADTGLSFWLVLPLAGLVTVPFGLAVGLPALNLSSLHLALLTLGFGLLIDQTIFNNLSLTRGGAGLSMERPSLPGLDLSSDLTFYYVLLVLTGIVALLVRNLQQSATGRVMRGIRNSEVGVSTVGINPMATKLLAFILSAFMAGMAGALFAAVRGQISALDFGMLQSLLFLVAITVAGVDRVVGAVLASMILMLGPKFFSGFPTPWDQSLTLWLGLAATFGLLYFRRGIMGLGTNIAAAVRDVATSHQGPFPGSIRAGDMVDARAGLVVYGDAEIRRRIREAARRVGTRAGASGAI